MRWRHRAHGDRSVPPEAALACFPAGSGRTRGRVVIGEDRELRWVAPDEPPRLTPGAARALLRLLREVAERISKPDDDKEHTNE